MPSLKPLHWKKLDCIFLKAGLNLERETDTHRVYSKADLKRPVIIPKYKEVGRDIILNNMRTAGLNRERFFELLKQC